MKLMKSNELNHSCRSQIFYNFVEKSRMKIYITAFLISISLGISGQLYIGPEVQVYPSGVIPGIRFEKDLSENSAMNFRLGFQYIRHRDLGVHEDERGSGYGTSIGYKRYLSSDKSGFALTLRFGVWTNNIDWRDHIDKPNEISGNTDIIVLQPTLLLEDEYILWDGTLFIPSIGFGYEWNAKTDGEPTGEGAILLIGVSFIKAL